MCQVDSETEDRWEPEPLHIGVELGELDSPPRRPGHDESQDSDPSTRIIVIDLA